MLKKTILALATIVISTHAFADDGRNHERPWHLFDNSNQPGRVVVYPGQAALIQVAPHVVYAPTPTPAPADYSQPTDYSQPADDSPPVFYSQPAQNARLRY